jgi:hypothetical protein
MHVKAFKQSKSFIAIREQQIHSINEQITKPRPKVPNGVAIMSHVPHTASNGDFLFVLLDWFFGVTT